MRFSKKLTTIYSGEFSFFDSKDNLKSPLLFLISDYGMIESG